MKKLALLFGFFFCITTYAQDSIAVNSDEKVATEEVKTKPAQHFTESDIIIDNESVEAKKFKSDLKKKYNTEEFDYTEKIEEKGFWDRLKEWFANWLKNLFHLSSTEKSLIVVNFIMKTIAIIIILYVIYIIAKLILNKEGKWIFGDASNKKVMHHEDIERNLRNVDFEKLIKETLKSNDRRLTIRYYYLWLLKKMAERNLIEWNPEKTNSDYLYEIKDERLKNDFQYVSYLYNYIWYGEFDVDSATFNEIQATFEKTIKTV